MIAGAWLSSPASSRGRIGRLKTKLISDGSVVSPCGEPNTTPNAPSSLAAPSSFPGSKNPASLDAGSTRALEARRQEGKEYKNAM